jgi:hypothetical protein
MKLTGLSVLAVLAGAVVAPTTRADDPTVLCSTYRDVPVRGESVSAICSAQTEDGTKTTSVSRPIEFIALTCACYDEDMLPASGFRH